MAVVEPWQLAEIPGPKKATVVSKASVIDALLKQAKRPVFIIGHQAADQALGDKRLIDYLVDLARARSVPIIATGNVNRELLGRGYTQATIMVAVEAGQRLADREWRGLDGKGPHDLAIFAGLPYYMTWTILSGLKHFAPQVRTLSLDNGYQPHASFSFANVSAVEWQKNLDALTGHQEG